MTLPVPHPDPSNLRSAIALDVIDILHDVPDLSTMAALLVLGTTR